MRGAFLGCILLLGCVPGSADPVQKCLVSPPPDGTLIIRPVLCSEELVRDGDGQLGDWLVANAHFHAVFRHPLHSLTVSGWGGGTLIDYAPWGESDRLHEVIPLTGDGWLRTENIQREGNALIVTGQHLHWPDETDKTSPYPVRLMWQFDPDTNRISVEGHDRLWIHPSRDLQLYKDRLISQHLTLNFDGSVAFDEGGAFELNGNTYIDIQSNILPPHSNGMPTRSISGTATGATHLAFFRQEQLVGRYNFEGDDFSLEIPDEIDHIRAQGANNATSKTLSPSTNMVLQLETPIATAFIVEWGVHIPRPLQAQWVHPELGTQQQLMSSGGGTLYLHPDVTEVNVSAGPHLEPLLVSVDPDRDTTAPITIQPKSASEFDDYKWVNLGGRGDRSKTWRGTDGKAFREAMQRGHDWTVFTPRFDVSAGAPWPDDANQTQWRHGVSAPHPEGWSIRAWPWEEKSRLAGRGLPDLSMLSAEDALARMIGSGEKPKFSAVTSGWFERISSAPSNAIMPDFVLVDDAFESSDPMNALSGWFERLDTGDSIPPLGLENWVPVNDPILWTGADVESQFLAGTAVASNGPLLSLDIEGYQPGDQARLESTTPPIRPSRVNVRIVLSGQTVDELLIVGEGGTIYGAWAGPITPGQYTGSIRTPKRWALAVAKSDGSGPWAMTGPIWFRFPR